ncbi:methyl-accepting chemotaxis protein [Alteromonas oceani]|jgi:methyl-accepting chemotaxis protein|uniref:Methyl-accepting chemotaxis protein n=2 Tax=Alteromonas TaxID=226 RepID=A0A2S9VAX3_9ALTE|nr:MULTISPECIES: methyl-accepting chemotaxis protein [Alteromonas]PRO73619.1 methyl-accepting chemotaxis protein [Alteromonas alba]
MRFSSLSIKQKLISILIIAVLASTLLVGTVQQFIARDMMETNMETAQLPNMVKQVANRVDKEVTLMKSVAFSIANNPDIIAWSAAGADKQGENRLVNYLGEIARFNDLTVTSFVDRNTHKYWNQEGFLRELKNDQYDGWFFAYKDSGQETSLSLYNEPGQGYRLFANYQQTNGRGMSGVAKSVDELVDVLNSVKIAESGFIYMTDGEGTIIAHSNTDLLGKSHLRDVTSGQTANQLLQQQTFNLARGEEMLYASTYVKSAGWYVIAQVPENELYSQMDNASLSMIFWSLVIAGGFALLGVWLAGTISKPIENLAAVFKQLGDGHGDLTKRIPLPEQRETRQLVDGFNRFIASLHDIISRVTDTSANLRQSAFEVASQSKTTQTNSEEQRDRTIQVATALTQMSHTVNDIASSAQAAAADAQECSSTSTNGLDTTARAVANINQLARQVSEVTAVIESLDSHTADIIGILDTIRGISEQTNLLALNAAIEAARAGDHGRGFSVVADEVRSLASRAAQSTDEIQSKIDKFKHDSDQALVKMRDSREQTEEVVSAAQNLESLLTSIASGIQHINDVNMQVATATEEQTQVIEDINQNIQQISTNSDDNLHAARQMVAVSDQLDSLAAELNEQVNRFTL